MSLATGQADHLRIEISRRIAERIRGASSANALVEALLYGAPAGTTLDEKHFRWQMNEDPMATDKLAEGIRAFAKDLGSLRNLVSARLADLGTTPLTGSPADFEKIFVGDTEKWGKLIKAANIKPE